MKNTVLMFTQKQFVNTPSLLQKIQDRDLNVLERYFNRSMELSYRSIIPQIIKTESRENDDRKAPPIIGYVFLG